MADGTRSVSRGLGLAVVAALAVAIAFVALSPKREESPFQIVGGADATPVPDDPATIEGLLRAGKLDEAAALIPSAERSGKDVVELRLQAGRAFLKQGLATRAAPLLQPLRARLDREELLVLAEVFAVTGDPRSSVEFFEAALAAGAARSAPLLARYAEAAAAAGDGPRALTLLDESLRLDPSSVPTRLNLATGLANSGNFDAARREARAVLKRDPGNAKAKELLQALDVAQGRLGAPAAGARPRV
jgi:tetratricopeptide (TPR) repeat protein